MAFFGNKRKDFSIQPPRQQVDGTPFFVTDSANIDFTLENLNLTANLTPTGVTSGIYGSATLIPILRVDQWGRITGVTTTTFSASGIALEVNGTPNLSQTILNLIDSATIQVVDLGGGDIEFNYIGTGGPATWGSITGTIASQTDLITYLTTNYYPLTGNPSGFLTSAVTSVGTGTGLTGGTITGTGTIQLNTKLAPADSLTGNAGKFLRVNAGATAVEYANVTSSNLNDTTGILFGGALSATIGGTTFSVTAGIGQIVTQTATISGVVTTVTNVTWSAVVGAAITNIATSQFTYVLVNSSGTVIQQTTPFTDAQYKTHIIIGILCHINLASVNLVTNSQNVAYEDPHRLVELISAFGPIKKTGLNIGPNGANLRVNRTQGEAFKIGANYTTDQFEPDVAIISAKTPAKLCRAYGNNSVGFTFDTDGGLFYDDIDRNQYFNPTTGVLETVGGSKWTIQRLFFFPNNPDDIICYYGVQTYNQFSEARANLEFETFDEATITAENAIFLGFLFVRHNATALNNPTQAAFLQSGLFRGIPPGGGGSGGGGDSIGELTGDVTTPAATAPSQSVAATLKANLKTGSFGVTVDGVTSIVQVGQVGYVTIPYDGTITGWSITANVAGNIQFDVWKDALPGVIPVLADSIITSNFPTLLGTNFNTQPVTGVEWTTTFAAGDVFGFYVNSASTIKNATLTIRTTRS
jgi:hypothetical protein